MKKMKNEIGVEEKLKLSENLFSPKKQLHYRQNHHHY